MLLAIAPVLMLSLDAPIPAQSQQPAFEVASIKPNRSGENSIGIFPSAGIIRVKNYTVKLLIEEAYGLKPYQVSGGPSWVNSYRYDIAAKADGRVKPQQRDLSSKVF